MRVSLPLFDGTAACAEVGGDDWFPEKGGATRSARAICEGCEIRLPCLKWSLDNREPAGMWGGVSENQRKRLLAGSGQRPVRDINHGSEGGLKAHQRRGEVVPESDPCGCRAAARLADAERRERRAS
jgi:hypothetical protein